MFHNFESLSTFKLLKLFNLFCPVCCYYFTHTRHMFHTHTHTHITHTPVAHKHAHTRRAHALTHMTNKPWAKAKRQDISFLLRTERETSLKRPFFIRTKLFTLTWLLVVKIYTATHVSTHTHSDTHTHTDGEVKHTAFHLLQQCFQYASPHLNTHLSVVNKQSRSWDLHTFLVSKSTKVGAKISHFGCPSS